MTRLFRRSARFVFAAAVILLFVRASPVIEDQRPKTGPVSGHVSAVLDGDTVLVRLDDGTKRKVRLIGIDTPEMGDTREPVRFMARMAKRFAGLKLNGKKVSLAFSWEIEDKYGRLLAYVTPEGGPLFNEEVLREGFAEVFHAFTHDPEMMKRFRRAEEDARKEGRGLWAKSGPPAVEPAELQRSFGKLVTVSLDVVQQEKRRGFVVLRPRAGDFEVVIPKSSLKEFGDIGSYTGRKILVSGLVESYRGVLQIMLFLPYQIRPVS